MMTILTLHSSPWIGGTNSAFTHGDKNGVDWLLTYRTTEIPVVKEDLSNYKYAQYFYETTGSGNSHNVSEYTFYRNLNKYTEIVPSHFGYTTNRTIGESFAYLPNKELYMTTTELMRRTVDAVQEDRKSQVKSFTDAEFIRLKNDPTINLVYVSNTFGVWDIVIP
jgi:hypothetical protein